MLRTIINSFTPLKSSNFRMYMSGQAVSLIGTWMQITGQSWVVWELSHSAAALGIVAMLGALPALILAPWVGSWSDRWDRRLLLIWTAVVSLVLAVIMALLVQTHTIQMWHIYLLAGLLGLVTALDNPAQNAFLGDLGGVKEVHKSFTMNAMAIQTSRMIGPAIAGWMIGMFGVPITFWLNALSFVAVVYSLVRVEAHQVHSKKTSNPLREFGEGLVFMKEQPRIADLIAFSGIIVLFGFGSNQIFPAFVSAALHGGPEALGALMSSFGAGALVSSLLLVPICQQISRTGLMLSIVLVWSGFWYTALGLTRSLPLAMVALFLGSFGQPVAMTSAKSMIQRLSPNTMWGRLTSVQIMVSTGLQPFANLGIGYAAELIGSPLTIAINGGVIMGASILMLLLRPGLPSWEVSVASGD